MKQRDLPKMGLVRIPAEGHKLTNEGQVLGEDY